MITASKTFAIVIALFMLVAVGWPAVPLLFLLACVMDWSGDGDGRQWMNNND